MFVADTNIAFVYNFVPPLIQTSNITSFRLLAIPDLSRSFNGFNYSFQAIISHKKLLRSVLKNQSILNNSFLGVIRNYQNRFSLYNF